MPEPFNEEHLSAYLDGELPAAERQAVEDWIKSDPAMQRALEEMRAVREELQQFYQQQSFSLPNPVAFNDEVIRRAERAALRAGDSAAATNGEVRQPAVEHVSPAKVHAADTWRSNLPALFTAAAAVVVLGLLVIAPQFFQATNVAEVPAERLPGKDQELERSPASTAETQGQPSGPVAGRKRSGVTAGLKHDGGEESGAPGEEEIQAVPPRAPLNEQDAGQQLGHLAQTLNKNPQAGRTDGVKATTPAGPETRSIKPRNLQPMLKGKPIGGGGFGGSPQGNAAPPTLEFSAHKGVTVRVETLRRGRFVDAVNLAVGSNVDLHKALASGEYELFVVTHQPSLKDAFKNSTVEKQEPSDKQRPRNSALASLSQSVLKEVTNQIAQQRNLDKLHDRSGKKKNYRRAITAPSYDNVRAGSEPRVAGTASPGSKGAVAKVRIANGAAVKPETEEKPEADEEVNSDTIQHGGDGNPTQPGGSAPAANEKGAKQEDAPQQAKFFAGKSNDYPDARSSWFGAHVPGDNVKLLIADVSGVSEMQLEQALLELKASAVQLQQVSVNRSSGLAAVSELAVDAAPLKESPRELAKGANNKLRQAEPMQSDAAPAADGPQFAPPKPMSVAPQQPAAAPAPAEPAPDINGDAKPKEPVKAGAEKASPATRPFPAKPTASTNEPAVPLSAVPEPAAKPPAAKKPASARPLAEAPALDAKDDSASSEPGMAFRRKRQAGDIENGADKAGATGTDENLNGSNLSRVEAALSRLEAKKSLELKQQAKPVQFFLLIRRKAPQDAAPAAKQATDK